jgi:hypothetical protein
VTRDSKGDAPTLEQVISQIQQERWEDIGALISDIGHGLSEVQAIRQQIRERDHEYPGPGAGDPAP